MTPPLKMTPPTKFETDPMNRKNFTSNQSFAIELLKSCQINFFFSLLRTRILFKTYISLHTHNQLIHYTYHSKAYDPKKKTWGAEDQFVASARSYKCLKIKQLAKTTSFASRAGRISFKMSLHTHIKNTCTMYTIQKLIIQERKRWLFNVYLMLLLNTTSA